MFPKQVKIVEVGPRDGLQNEAQQVTTDVKLAFIAKLAASGLRTIEATAFVSPKWVPQMADHAAVLSALDTAGDVDYPVLVPNLKGLENAITCGAKRVAILLAASETFSKKNTNVSIAQSVANARAIHQAATDAGISVRAYISCVMGCPYEGAIDPAVVVDLTEQALAMGCDEVSLGDTIGVGTPNQMTDLLHQNSIHVILVSWFIVIPRTRWIQPSSHEGFPSDAQIRSMRIILGMFSIAAHMISFYSNNSFAGSAIILFGIPPYDNIALFVEQ